MTTRAAPSSCPRGLVGTACLFSTTESCVRHSFPAAKGSRPFVERLPLPAQCVVSHPLLSLACREGASLVHVCVRTTRPEQRYMLLQMHHSIPRPTPPEDTGKSSAEQSRPIARPAGRPQTHIFRASLCDRAVHSTPFCLCHPKAGVCAEACVVSTMCECACVCHHFVLGTTT